MFSSIQTCAGSSCSRPNRCACTHAPKSSHCNVISPALCDREAAHGNFRAWAKTTHHLTVGMKETGRGSVDEQQLRWAYSELRHRRAA